jgi:hypothetical protein
MKNPELKRNLLILNNAVLFLCTSIYLGTGWSLLLFSFPIEPQLTVDNYYLQFVPQVTLATQFFTYMTTLMIVLAIIMTIAEWKTGLRWFPIIVLSGIVVATSLTVVFILPLNDMMSKGITDPVQLKSILHKWIFLNQIRVVLWTIQWLSMMIYFSYQENIAGRAKVAGAEQ